MSMSWRKHQSGLNELCKELLEKGVAVRTIDEAHLHPWQQIDPELLKQITGEGATQKGRVSQCAAIEYRARTPTCCTG